MNDVVEHAQGRDRYRRCPPGSAVLCARRWAFPHCGSPASGLSTNVRSEP